MLYIQAQAHQILKYHDNNTHQGFIQDFTHQGFIQDFFFGGGGGGGGEISNVKIELLFCLFAKKLTEIKHKRRIMAIVGYF